VVSNEEFAEFTQRNLDRAHEEDETVLTEAPSSAPSEKDLNSKSMTMLELKKFAFEGNSQENLMEGCNLFPPVCLCLVQDAAPRNSHFLSALIMVVGKTIVTGHRR
jgi:hypothetical protein